MDTLLANMDDAGWHQVMAALGRVIVGADVRLEWHPAYRALLPEVSA